MRSSCNLISLVASLAAPALLSAQSYPSAADPRNNLKPGRMDAAVAASNMRLVSFTPKPAQFDTARGLTFINSDLAFGNGHYVYQGNFAGFMVWDVSDPAKPVLASVVECITSQGDPSIIGNLLFVSAEGGGNRNDCGKGGVQDPKDHMTGIRIYDVSDPKAPKLIKNVQTCKGSHTHTVIPSPTDPKIVYIYVSGQQNARPETELAGCKNGDDPADPTNSLYMLDIIKVPLDHPEQAAVIPGARIFTGLEGSPDCITFCAPADTRRAGGGRGGRGARGAAPGAGDSANARPLHTGPRNCHDVTAYPAYHLLGAACSSHAIMVDISNPEKLARRTTELGDFIVAATRTYELERDGIVAVGFSNGANIAASLLLRRPELLRGAVLLSPMVPFEPNAVPNLSSVAIFIGAGRSDHMVLAAQTERLAELLRQAGADVTLHWEPDGHAITKDEIAAASRWIARCLAASVA